MASLGSASIGVGTTPKVVSTDLGPAIGSPLATGVFLGSTGSDGGSVDPKRYLNVGGTATPIQ